MVEVPVNLGRLTRRGDAVRTKKSTLHVERFGMYATSNQALWTWDSVEVSRRSE